MNKKLKPRQPGDEGEGPGMFRGERGTSDPHYSNILPGRPPGDPAFSQNWSEMRGREMPRLSGSVGTDFQDNGETHKGAQEDPCGEEKRGRRRGGEGVGEALTSDLPKLILGWRAN